MYYFSFCFLLAYPHPYAERGKSTMGWCFGFKLHLICNERGELLNFIPNRSLGLLFAVQHREILMTDLGL